MLNNVALKLLKKIQSVLNFHGYLAKHPPQTGCRLKGVWFWVRGDQKKGAPFTHPVIRRC